MKRQSDSRLTINECRKRITRFSAFVGLLSFIVLAACKSPFDRARDSSGGGALGTFGSSSMVIFSNELKSGGGAFLYPGGENQTLSFSDTSNPISARSIRYNWNGGDVSAPGCSPDPEHTFAGFDLMHTPTLATYDSTAGRDLHQTGYTKVTFFARGTLSTNTVIKVEVAAAGVAAGCPVPPLVPCVTLSTNGMSDDPNNPCGVLGQLTSSWHQFTITGITPSNLSNVKDLFKATFVFDPAGGNTPGQGGTVYFDNIQYSL